MINNLVTLSKKKKIGILFLKNFLIKKSKRKILYKTKNKANYNDKYF